jgi:hypothetical protein
MSQDTSALNKIGQATAQAAKPSVSRPAPVAPKIAKAAAKPSGVPPRTPPAVASAIQKLAAKKQNRR